jgi:hypothetical protein
MRCGTFAVRVRNITAITEASGHACREQNRHEELHVHSFGAGARSGRPACASTFLRYSGSTPQRPSVKVLQS